MCKRTFVQTALRLFEKYHLRRVDHVILPQVLDELFSRNILYIVHLEVDAPILDTIA